MAISTEIGQLLAQMRTIITYSPLRTEVPVGEIVPISEGVRIYTIPPRASIDPLDEAAATKAFAGDETIAILIPGRTFDSSGTRHGQGGGWYDRFLASVPREWLRIGFCFEDQLSETLLPRESWDQAMDYVVVVNRATGGSTLYSSEGAPS